MPIVQALISKNGKYGISKFTKNTIKVHVSPYRFVRRIVSKQYTEETAFQCDGVAGICAHLLSTTARRSHR